MSNSVGSLNKTGSHHALHECHASRRRCSTVLLASADSRPWLVRILSQYQLQGFESNTTTIIVGAHQLATLCSHALEEGTKGIYFWETVGMPRDKEMEI